MSGFLAGTKFLNMLLSNEAFTQKIQSYENPFSLQFKKSESI